jgi:uncharacterized RDD family membrane protein YckC
MKLSTRQLFLSAAIALFFTVTLATMAQEPATTPPPPPAKSADTPPPDADKKAAQPVPGADKPATPAPAPAATPGESTPAPKVAPDKVPEEPIATADDADAADADIQPATPKAEPEKKDEFRRLDVPSKEKRSRRHRVHMTHRNGNNVFVVGHNAALAKDQKADSVIAIFGSATAEGEVSDVVVSVIGNTKAYGPVGDSVVAVFGNTYVDGKVGDLVVSVFGTVELGPNADVQDVVAVGGDFKRDPKAIVHGEIRNVVLGGIFADMDWLHSWFVQCAMRGRLLGFGPHLAWAWWIAFSFLGLYVVLGLLFGRGMYRCVDTLEQRPGYSILTALLTVLLAPVVMIILVLTGVGIAILPFLGAALFFAGIFGKAVMLAWLGKRVMSPFGVLPAALAVLVGGVLILLSYTVPILGIVLYKLFGWVGLGVVVYTLILNMKRERPPAAPIVPPPAPVLPVIDPVTGMPMPEAGTAIPVMVATTLPRAGFWIRTAALGIDTVIIGVVVWLFQMHGRMEMLLLAVYAATMWKMRGTTVGGIICGLKVIRLDGRPLDWTTAIVRALGCFVSLVVVGLGFIWVVFDDQKQSWHDKIAGTTVVRVPKGVSLV